MAWPERPSLQPPVALGHAEHLGRRTPPLIRIAQGQIAPSGLSDVLGVVRRDRSVCDRPCAVATDEVDMAPPAKPLSKEHEAPIGQDRAAVKRLKKPSQ